MAKHWLRRKKRIFNKVVHSEAGEKFGRAVTKKLAAVLLDYSDTSQLTDSSFFFFQLKYMFMAPKYLTEEAGRDKWQTLLHRTRSAHKERRGTVNNTLSSIKIKSFILSLWSLTSVTL